MLTIRDIAFVRFAAPQLDVMKAFLLDFGLHLAHQSDSALYMRAANGLPFAHVTEAGPARALGFGLLAQQRADLDALAVRMGVRVEDNPEPGGGQRVRIVDPSGFIVDVLHGQQSVPSAAGREPIELNSAGNRRRVGRTVRLSPQPSSVARLGHVALLVPDFRRSVEFYRDVFGLRPSDNYYGGVPENVVASFMHCGLGETYTDHHTVALLTARDGVARFDHVAFEVLDLDDLMQGNRHLQARGYTHSWGVGRHIQGSQIFDYWRDPFNNKIEHWTDGDLVNDSTPVGLSELSESGLWQWAPPLKPDFFS